MGVTYFAQPGTLVGRVAAMHGSIVLLRKAVEVYGLSAEGAIAYVRSLLNPNDPELIESGSAKFGNPDSARAAMYNGLQALAVIEEYILGAKEEVKNELVH